MPVRDKKLIDDWDSSGRSEHILRFHSWDFWCQHCKKNFPRSSRDSVNSDKGHHGCQPRDWEQGEEMTRHTCMTREQQEQWRKWKESPKAGGSKDHSTTIRNWNIIFRIFNPTKDPPELEPSE